MKKRFTAVCLVWVLCFVAVVTPKTAQVKAKSSTIVVPDDYATIQLAVNHAEDGDTVLVKKGTYHGSVYIDRALSLVAEGPNTKIINDDRLNGTVILIRHDNVNVSGFAIESYSASRSRRGIHLLHVKFCNISGNSIRSCGCGIWLYGSSFNNIEENNVNNNINGIIVALSDHNTFTENSVAQNFYAIELSDSVNNIFRSNKVSSSSQNFVFSGTKSTYFNDVDSSNTIDNQLVCYWVNQHNQTVPSSVGYVFLVNCTGITVQDTYVIKNYKEILVVYTNRSEIRNANVMVRLISSFYNKVSECSGTIQLEGSWYNMITKNYIANGGKISLFDSGENIISSNTIQNGKGIVLQQNSRGNMINGNKLTNNYEAISIYDSAPNSFRSNKLVDNTIPLFVSAQFQTLSDLFNYVDQTNTVNGKPIVYWVNETNKAVPSNAGEVVLVNCSQILVENLTLIQGGSITLAWTKNSTLTNNILKNGQGIQLTRFSNDNTVYQNTLTENTHGIAVSESSRIQIIENNVTDNTYRGIQLQDCQNVNVSDNIIVSNEYEGVALLDHTRYNTVSNNHIAYNDVGILLEGASENLISKNMILENIDWGMELLRDQHSNRIYHNYFIDNSKGKWTLQVSIPAVNYHGTYIDGYPNIWDDGQKGNYWSEYQTRYPEAKETENTGTGDTPFYINPNNLDNHPVTDPNTIPEFPSWALLLVLLATTSTAVFCKKKLKHAIQQSY